MMAVSEVSSHLILVLFCGFALFCGIWLPSSQEDWLCSGYCIWKIWYEQCGLGGRYFPPDRVCISCYQTRPPGGGHHLCKTAWSYFQFGASCTIQGIPVGLSSWKELLCSAFSPCPGSVALGVLAYWICHIPCIGPVTLSTFPEPGLGFLPLSPGEVVQIKVHVFHSQQIPSGWK